MNPVERIEKWFRQRQKEKLAQEFENLKDEILTKAAGKVIDDLLYLLLKAMSILFVIDKEFRENIKEFSGSYVIRSEDNMVDVSAVFKKVRILFSKTDGMEVKDDVIENPTTTVSFKDGKAMAEFMLAGNPDVIAGMLNNQLNVSGNLNYLFKFIYMLRLIPERLGVQDFATMLNQRS